jgi:catechol 2,3-dioxygenase-like lactoylglutathione lyase family enzyme
VFDHVTIRASDRKASERFYETVLRPLGIEKTHSDAQFAEWDDFSMSQASGEKPVTRRLHIAFVAPSRELVDEFWRVGREAGFRDDGPPGPRPQYSASYYGSFLLDPDGNSAEAVHHDSIRKPGFLDHLWIRVADVAASKRFYETVAPHAGFRLNADTPDRAQFVGRAARSRSCRGRRPNMSTWRSRRRRTRPSTSSTGRLSRRATRQTARRASGRSTTRATTARSSSTPTRTTSRS